MNRIFTLLKAACLCFSLMLTSGHLFSQVNNLKYPTLELFTNTPCPICGSQNPGLFSRLQNFEGRYHLISFYPGKPYASCIFYQSNISENTTRFHFYSQIFGTPTVAINGLDFKSSSGVTTALLNSLTGGESWLKVKVEETSGTNRTADITLQDLVGGSLSTGRLFAVIVEKQVAYTAPNGETMHHNVFRKFLGPADGEDVHLSSGSDHKSYTYAVDPDWVADEVYIIAWVADPATKEIYNSGTRFDPDIISGVGNVEKDIALKIYPNPASNEFRISLPGKNEEFTIRITDSAGKQMLAQKYSTTSSVKVDCASWSEGIYIVKVNVNGKEMSGKLQVVR